MLGPHFAFHYKKTISVHAKGKPLQRSCCCVSAEDGIQFAGQ